MSAHRQQAHIDAPLEAVWALVAIGVLVVMVGSGVFVLAIGRYG